MDLTKSELANIANNLILTDHAEDRLFNRGSEYKLEHIEDKIKNSPLAWVAHNKDIKIQVGAKLLLILKKKGDKFIGITTYHCNNRKSRGSKKKSHKDIKYHYKRDKEIWQAERTKKLLRSRNL